MKEAVVLLSAGAAEEKSIAASRLCVRSCGVNQKVGSQRPTTPKKITSSLAPRAWDVARPGPKLSSHTFKPLHSTVTDNHSGF